MQKLRPRYVIQLSRFFVWGAQKDADMASVRTFRLENDWRYFD
jgi:hypothetical protein